MLKPRLNTSYHFLHTSTTCYKTISLKTFIENARTQNLLWHINLTIQIWYPYALYFEGDIFVIVTVIVCGNV